MGIAKRVLVTGASGFIGHPLVTHLKCAGYWGARPQQRRHQVLHRLGVEGHRGHERQVAPRGVVAIEEGELLLPVGRIVGRIEVDGDEPDTSRRPGSRLARRDNCSCTRRS